MSHVLPKRESEAGGWGGPGAPAYRTGRLAMRFLPTRVHGVLDYLYGLAVIAGPWLLGFARGGAETWVPVTLGAAYLVVSLFTDYELSVVRAVPMPVHLAIDGLGGAFLAASPWIFGFADHVYLPHLLVGLFAILASSITETRPRSEAPRAAVERR